MEMSRDIERLVKIEMEEIEREYQELLRKPEDTQEVEEQEAPEAWKRVHLALSHATSEWPVGAVRIAQYLAKVFVLGSNPRRVAISYFWKC